MFRYVTVLFALTAWAVDIPYHAAIAKWRHQKEAELKADGGWLTVTGLFWLKHGDNRVASAPGAFELRDSRVLYRPDRGPAIELKAGASVTEGARTFILLERGGRYGIRLKDKESKLRAEFRGQQWFPVRESYRVNARFVAYEQPKPMAILNVLGDTLQLPSPGYTVFMVQGRELRLDPVIEEKKLFFIFRDQTAGKETYGAGRFLYAELPRDGKVEIDFNKA